VGIGVLSDSEHRREWVPAQKNFRGRQTRVFDRTLQNKQNFEIFSEVGAPLVLDTYDCQDLRMVIFIVRLVLALLSLVFHVGIVRLVSDKENQHIIIKLVSHYSAWMLLVG